VIYAYPKGVAGCCGTAGLRAVVNHHATAASEAEASAWAVAIKRYLCGHGTLPCGDACTDRMASLSAGKSRGCRCPPARWSAPRRERTRHSSRRRRHAACSSLPALVHAYFRM
jgi:hypothetical protein